jgi:hypothetical protein
MEPASYLYLLVAVNISVYPSDIKLRNAVLLHRMDHDFQARLVADYSYDGPGGTARGLSRSAVLFPQALNVA